MLYQKYLSMHIKSSFEYRLNTLFMMFTSSLNCIAEFFSIWLLFTQFETVGTWGFYETALMYGIVNTVFSLIECFGRGFDEFSKLIKEGGLDRMLVRPRNMIYQIFGSKIEFSKFGRIIMGIIVSIIAIINLGINWSIIKILVLIGAYICGIFIVLGIMMINAGISVFSIENLEFVNILTYGGKELSYYPLNIYNKWLTRFFTFIVPLACFNYLPLSFIMGTGSIPSVLCALSPLLGSLFIIPCILFFNFSLKKYQGTNT